MATRFYTCAGKLDTEAAHISAVGRVSHLADHAHASMSLTHSMGDFMDCYTTQRVDPSRWTIKSFHDPTGTLVANIVTDVDPQILKPTGHDTNNTAAANRRVANIQYASISVQVDLSSVTEDHDNKVELNTVIKLPMENRTIKDGHGNDVVVHTFQGNDDIRTYTVDD